MWDVKANKLSENSKKTFKERNLTIATAAQDSNFNKDQQKLKSRKRERALIETADYFQLVKSYTEQRDIIKDFLIKESKQKEGFKIILKPHPRENCIYWENLIKNLNSKRINIMLNETIDSLLKESDIHLAFSACTTTIEALMLGIRTLELESSLTNSLYDDAHTSMQIKK